MEEGRLQERNIIQMQAEAEDFMRGTINTCGNGTFKLVAVVCWKAGISQAGF
jgi:hypothetical protein